MSTTKPNGEWCSRHKAQRHEQELSERNRRDILWYRRERARWIAIVTLRHRYPKTPFPLNSEPLAQWVARHHLSLDALRGKCAKCGREDELEFQHDQPRDWEPNKTSRWQRLRNYIRDIKVGKITRLLCRSCNAAAGYPKGQGELPIETDPF